MTIQLHRLEGFYRVALARSYARAARAFPYPITAPGVHAQVRLLEGELGTPLFERSGRDSLRTTPAGEALLAFCAPYFEALPRVLESIAKRSFGGTLRIDAAPLFTEELLPAWLSRLRALRPDVDVAVHDAHVPSLDRLRAGETDLLIDYVPRVPDGFGARTLGASHAFLAVPAGHPFARRRDPRALERETFIAYAPELPHHALQMDALRARIGEPARTITAPSVAALLAFVRAGLGFTVVPWPDPRGPTLAGVALFRQDSEPFPIRAVFRRTTHPHPLLEAALSVAPSPDEARPTKRPRRAKRG
jgi:DNA-binding transcriptional LysR family regulator